MDPDNRTVVRSPHAVLQNFQCVCCCSASYSYTYHALYPLLQLAVQSVGFGLAEERRVTVRGIVGILLLWSPGQQLAAA